MKRTSWILAAILVVAALGAYGILGSLAAEGDAAKADAKPAHQYVGAAKCKICHMSAASGAAYKVWSESKHASAFAVLASDKGKEIAKANSIDDPQKADLCLGCHTTGHGQPAAMFAEGFDPTLGVQCETCHGPGSDYKAMAVMKGITAGTMKAADYGLEMPTAETCVQCHNEKGHEKPKFDWAADSTAIAHPIPKK
jgi:hypothetical protein